MRYAYTQCFVDRSGLSQDGPGAISFVGTTVEATTPREAYEAGYKWAKRRKHLPVRYGIVSNDFVKRIK